MTERIMTDGIESSRDLLARVNRGQGRTTLLQNSVFADEKTHERRPNAARSMQFATAATTLLHLTEPMEGRP